MLYRKIDILSPDSISSGFDFFSYLCTNTSFSKSQYREINPLNPVTQVPLHFRYSGGSGFPDFNHMYLKTEIVVEKLPAGAAAWVPIEGGSGPGVNPPVAPDNISMVQAPGQAFIRNLKATSGGREIYNSNNLQCWKSHIDTELSYSQAAKDTHLALMGYYPDSLNQNDPAGNGFAQRRARIANGKVAEFITKIDADPFNVDKYFLNNTDFEIEIIPNDDNFLILAPALPNADKVRYRIVSCKLFVLVHDAMDGIALSMAKRLEKEPAKYAVRRTELKHVYLPANQTHVEMTVFGDQIPRKVYVVFLTRTDFDGDIRTSPFNFKNFDIEWIRIDWNGLSNPNVMYDLDFTNDKYSRAYYDMQMACGNAFTPMSNGITMPMFKEGWTIFTFNLTSNLEDEKCFELVRQGTTSLSVKFKTQIPAPGVMALLYGEFDSLMMIDNNRTVTTDLTV